MPGRLYLSFTLGIMPSHEHHRSRVATTSLVAFAHLYLSLMGILGVLNYTVPTKYIGLEVLASSTLWTWIHGITGLLIIGSLFLEDVKFGSVDTPAPSIMCSVGFAFMLIWAFFNLMWGVTTIRPVSLAAPGLAFAVAVGEQLLANAWTRGAPTKDR